jgi:hypothetical protein
LSTAIPNTLSAPIEHFASSATIYLTTEAWLDLEEDFFALSV